jgi:hypothetical protein
MYNQITVKKLFNFICGVFLLQNRFYMVSAKLQTLITLCNFMQLYGSTRIFIPQFYPLQ